VGGELVIDAFDGGASNMENPGKGGAADAVVVLAIGVFSEGFAAAGPGKDSGQRREKGVIACASGSTWILRGKLASLLSTR